MYDSSIDWGSMSQEASVLAGAKDRSSLTHSALQQDHMLTPCQSEREKTTTNYTAYQDTYSIGNNIKMLKQKKM